jgi:TonB family protein
MRTPILLALFAVCNAIFAQSGSDGNAHQGFVSAKYPGGLEMMYETVQRNLKYPRKEKRAGMEGVVEVSFSVDTAGRVDSIVVERGLSDACDAAAVKAMGALSEWTPAEHNGKPVALRFTMPVVFRLNQEKQ